jgi:hypothetical protein
MGGAIRMPVNSWVLPRGLRRLWAILLFCACVDLGATATDPAQVAPLTIDPVAAQVDLSRSA